MVPALTQAAMLQNPDDSGVGYSGIKQVIFCWKCGTKGALTVRFNGGKPIPLRIWKPTGGGTSAECVSMPDNGFVPVWNRVRLGGRNPYRCRL